MSRDARLTSSTVSGASSAGSAARTVSVFVRCPPLPGARDAAGPWGVGIVERAVHRVRGRQYRAPRVEASVYASLGDGHSLLLHDLVYGNTIPCVLKANKELNQQLSYLSTFCQTHRYRPYHDRQEPSRLPRGDDLLSPGHSQLLPLVQRPKSRVLWYLFKHIKKA